MVAVHMAQSALEAFSVLDQKLDCKTVVYLKLLVQHVHILEMLVSRVLVRETTLHATHEMFVIIIFNTSLCKW
jgi:succinyl-CoA synthetase beta subunit